MIDNQLPNSGLVLIALSVLALLAGGALALKIKDVEQNAQPLAGERVLKPAHGPRKSTIIHKSAARAIVCHCREVELYRTIYINSVSG